MNIVEFADTHKIKWRPVIVKVKKNNNNTYSKELMPMLGSMPDVKHFANSEWCSSEMLKLQKFYKGLSQVEKDKYTISLDTSKILHWMSIGKKIPSIQMKQSNWLMIYVRSVHIINRQQKCWENILCSDLMKDFRKRKIFSNFRVSVNCIKTSIC